MISNKGFNEGIITLYVDESTAVGTPVSMTDSGSCSASNDGDKFVGILVNSRAGIGAVQVKGYANIPYSGTDLTLGITEIAADGNGKIKMAAGGRTVTVIGVNTAEKTAELLM